MQLHLFVLIVVLSGQWAAFSQAEEDLRTKTPIQIINMTNARTCATVCQRLRALPADDRAEILRGLHEELVDARVKRLAHLSAVGENEFPRLFIALGDREAIERWIVGYRRDPEAVTYTIITAGNPDVIAAMGDDLYLNNLNQTVREGRDVTPIEGKAGYAWRVVRGIILNAAEFSEDLKGWARLTPRLPRSEYPEQEDKVAREEMNTLREWWRENREAALAGRYTSMKPGRLLPAWDTRFLEARRIELSAHANAKPATPESSKTSQATRDQSEAKSRNSGVLWIILAACAAVAAIVVILANRAVRRR